MNIVPEIINKNNIRTEVKQKKQSEFHLIGNQNKTPGHKLFEFNKTTKMIREADIKADAILDCYGTIHKETKVFVKQDCFYIQALNRKNAEKKLKKIGML
ncbi:MAG: hypothetical protein J6Q19_04865 [Bacteroidaceae bacterium]|nr:hypothetical protein [Bacteroidaceae bacterium]